MKPLIVRVTCLLFLGAAPLVASGLVEDPTTRLVLQITVDQLRGDQPTLMRDRFGAGGFRYLMEEGAYYKAANYSHSITETAPGHATLFTGASPREHGIIGNEWFDAETGLRVYNCEDDSHALVGEEFRAGSGTSPTNLMCSTITDELRLARGESSKVFAVSVKDRGAILPAGHLGKAFWYSSSTGGFVTSDYYYESYPEWVEAWNNSGVVDGYRDTQWELAAPLEEYRWSQVDERECERSYKHLGKTFPHPLSDAAGEGYQKALRYTPAGDEIVASFAKQLIEAEGLGQDDVPDFLALSFSATDYVGHVFGPLSLEAEDNLLHLDATLADLFAYIDEHVGLKNTLVVLSADHGAPDCPEHLAGLGRAVGWVDAPQLIKNANGALKEHFDTDEELLRAHVTPYLWLDHPKIAELELDPKEVADVAAAGALRTKGLALAVPRWKLEGKALGDSPLNSRLQAAFHAERSGDVYLVPEPQWLLGIGNASAVLSSLHGSPWRYDTHVPIMIAGPGISEGSYYREVAPRDIAPTVALLLGIKAPAVTTGEPLFEALGD
jgi:predicted AlkP superfamily pyrophosphatase or phosphodiesterase